MPLFVLGPPRSGTTLVAKVLNAHPDILVTNETRIMSFFARSFRELPTGDRGGLHCAREHGDEIVAALRSHGRALIEAAYSRIAAAQGKPGARYWGDKNPHASESLDLMAEWFPDAVFVVVRRDPRDTVCSILEMWCRMGLVVAAPSRAVGWHVDPAKLRQVCSSVRSATQREDDFLAGLGKARFFRLRYERLVTEPEAVLRPLVVEFLGLQSAEPALQAMRAVAAKDVHGAVGGRVDFVARSVGRWRRDLTADQQDLVDGELRELVVAGDVAPGS